MIIIHRGWGILAVIIPVGVIFGLIIAQRYYDFPNYESLYEMAAWAFISGFIIHLLLIIFPKLRLHTAKNSNSSTTSYFIITSAKNLQPSFWSEFIKGNIPVNHSLYFIPLSFYPYIFYTFGGLIFLLEYYLG